jgi:EmrB/QacA subfamily drug resistance transporter
MVDLQHIEDGVGGTGTRRPFVLAALMLASFMAAVESTIVATTMPNIAAELGGFSSYSWVFSAYFLTQAISIPIFGKLADLFGRKHVFIVGILFFLLGSILCGLSTSIGMLIAFRFLQGFGAGAVLPLAVTIAGDLYNLQERGRVQSHMASVWGVAALLGPLTGALIIKYADWPWIFWLNVPFGLAAIALVWVFLHEQVAVGQRRIDYHGAALFFVALAALMFALTESARLGALPLTLLLMVSVVALALFLRQERRAPDPMMHLEIWRDPLIASANTAFFAAGMVLIGTIVFVPTYVQAVLGRPPLEGGLALTSLSVGWTLAAMAAGRFLLSIGVRTLSRIGGTTLLAGTLLLALLSPYGVLPVGASAFVVGIGFGLLNPTFIIAIQQRVDWEKRGVATSTYMLMRFLGNSVGAALLAGVLALSLERYAAGHGADAGFSMSEVQALLQKSGSEASSFVGAGLFEQGLSHSLSIVFWVMAVIAVVAALISWRMPDLKK